jgi:tetratricopeptide (TPR) repeat protein
MKQRLKNKGEQIDSYLYALLFKIRQLSIKLRVVGDFNLSSTTIKKFLYDDKGFFENGFFLGFHKAYLEPFGYISWEDFIHRELELKVMLGLVRNESEWDSVIGIIIEELEANYYKNNPKTDSNKKSELARKFYDKSFINEQLHGYEDAVKKMEYAIRLQPENVFYYLRIAELFHRRGDILECIEYLGKITVNPYDTTFPIIVRHNTALAIRGLGLREFNPNERRRLLLVAKEELGDIYQNKIGSNSTLQAINLKFKVGINYCYSLLDTHDFNNTGAIYGELYTLLQSGVSVDDEYRIRLEMLLSILESKKDINEGRKLFDKLYDSFTQNTNINKNFELLSEITSCWSAHYTGDTDKQIEILEKSFPEKIWGQRSDIEYKNMLQLADLHEFKKQHQEAKKYLNNVLGYSYLDIELKENIERRIRFYDKMMNQ